MAKPKISYICTECGYKTIQKLGRCPDCKSFSTLQEEVQIVQSPLKKSRMTSGDSSAKKLKDVVSTSTSHLLITGISEFDRVVGGGLVADSVNVLSAPPGAGKSTLLLAIGEKLSENGKIVLYIAGEESESQVKLRAERILSTIPDNFYIKSETNLETILATMDNISPDFVVVDSIQMIFSNECDGTLGGEKQLMHCASSILNKAKNSGDNSTCVFFVGQVTKEDELRGTREFEHLVDAVFNLNVGDDTGTLRILKPTKNRFGDTSEVGLFEMSEDGLKEITNPNKYFITDRKAPIAGSAITAISEGSRTIAIEINTLTESNNFSYPSRISLGIGKDFLQIMLAILDNKLGSLVKKKDVYVQTSNGIKVRENSIGLAIIVSIYSALNNFLMPNGVVFVGEVSLTGEVKKVPNVNKIISDLERMGFKKVIVPANNKTKSFSKIDVIEISNIKEIINILKTL